MKSNETFTGNLGNLRNLNLGNLGNFGPGLQGIQLPGGAQQIHIQTNTGGAGISADMIQSIVSSVVQAHVQNSGQHPAQGLI